MGTIAAPEPGVMTSALPVVHFIPQQIAEQSSCLVLACPLYQTSARAGMLSSTGQSTNFVLHLTLPIPDGTTAGDWILQGVAAVCSVHV